MLMPLVYDIWVWPGFNESFTTYSGQAQVPRDLLGGGNPFPSDPMFLQIPFPGILPPWYFPGLRPPGWDPRL